MKQETQAIKMGYKINRNCAHTEEKSITKNCQIISKGIIIKRKRYVLNRSYK